MKKYKTAYMCAVDFEEELTPDNRNEVCIYNSLKQCKEDMGKLHFESCGAVKVKITKIKTIKKGKLK